MKTTPINQISRRFFYNVRRVAHLLALYNAVDGRTGLETEYKGDLLRSSVVFLHAALEDLLRQLLKFKSSENPAIFGEKLRLRDFSEEGKGSGALKVTDLYALRGKTVDEILEEAIETHLKRRSFNDKDEINNAIIILGLKPGDYAKFSDSLHDMTQRRHKIVHEGDRKDHGGDSHGRPRSIGIEAVDAWAKAVNQFGKGMLAQMGATEMEISSSN